VGTERGCRWDGGGGGEVMGKWGKCDLKTGHGRPSSSAFDRT
jgi:hypothetical protein